MFATSFLALAAVASFAVAAPIEQRGAPAGWAYGYLEDYETYHIRYLALKCYEKKHSDYFQDCCRPMLSTETLADNRKSYCVPSAEDTAYVTSSLGAKAAGGATPTASADHASESEYCESEESASSAAPTNTYVAAAYSSSSPAAKVAAESKAGGEYYAPAPTTEAKASTTTKAAEAAYTPSTTTKAPESKYTPPATTAAPTTQAPAPQSNNNGGGETFTGGFATYFFQGGQAGACGTVHGDGDYVVAIDQARWGSSNFGAGSSTCGRSVTITNTNNGRTVSAVIADVCPTCANGNSLDLSQGAFRAIANDVDGMVPISWRFN